MTDLIWTTKGYPATFTELDKVAQEYYAQMYRESLQRLFNEMERQMGRSTTKPAVQENPSDQEEWVDLPDA